jgi:hypothetical protein
LKQPLADESQRCAEGAESADQFIGAQHQMRRHPDTEQRRHHQHPAAASNGVYEAGQQRSKAQQHNIGYIQNQFHAY